MMKRKRKRKRTRMMNKAGMKVSPNEKGDFLWFNSLYSLFESQMIVCPKRSTVSFHGGLGVCHCLKWGDGFFIQKASPTQFWDWPTCWLWMMIFYIQELSWQFNEFGSSWGICMETSLSIIPSVMMTNNIGKPLCLTEAILSWTVHHSMTVENVFLLSFEQRCLCFGFSLSSSQPF